MKVSLLLIPLLLGSCGVKLENKSENKKEIVKIEIVETGVQQNLRFNVRYFIYVAPDSIERKAYTDRNDAQVGRIIRLEIDSTKNGRVYPTIINSF